MKMKMNETVWLDELAIEHTLQGWGEPQRNRSVDGKSLSIGGQSFERGLGTHGESLLVLDLKGAATRFQAFVGVDDEVARDHTGIAFVLVGDSRELWRSDFMKRGQPAAEVDADLSGVRQLQLQVIAAGYDVSLTHANWADARITHAGDTPEVLPREVEEAVILTPPPPPTPRINGARVFGVRPGHPFLFTIAATGERPITFGAEGLPDGLTLDEHTGRITGTTESLGEHDVALTATNELGEAQRTLRIVVGDRIALTPPMGWNSWNCFAHAVTQEKVKEAADAMVESGLINHGWSYINIDDYWEKKPASRDPSLQGPGRDEEGRMVPNPRFPNMKGLADYVHGLGLKIGIYSSPGPTTCGGCLGSYEHEKLDARSYAEWEMDYLKYDWCSYNGIAKDNSRDELMKPYRVMRDALDEQPRDIVYSLCQYGMGNVSEWGREVGGNCWRTTGDITDTWGSMAGIGFRQSGLEAHARPGEWNDPDMLVVGQVGWGPKQHPTKLTPNEQYTHISLWCLLSSPLLIGCDMTRMDDFTLGLLTNDEVLDVSQDPLGRQAARLSTENKAETWAKEMEDGSRAAGLFNLDYFGELSVTLRWSDLGISGRWRVRDLWRQEDLGIFEEAFTAEVPSHGVVMVRLWPTG